MAEGFLRSTARSKRREEKGLWLVCAGFTLCDKTEMAKGWESKATAARPRYAEPQSRHLLALGTARGMRPPACPAPEDLDTGNKKMEQKDHPLNSSAAAQSSRV